MAALTINGKTQDVDVDPNTPLLWALREQVGLTGTKYGCGIAQCGACTVHVDGRAIKSCSMLAVQADGTEIKTIEGLADGEDLHPMQAAFWEKHGLQCGFCTPGMVLTAKAFLERNASPTEQEVRVALEGNICRCTGYVFIVDSVLHAAELMGEGADV